MISDEVFNELQSFLSQVETCDCSNPRPTNPYPFRYKDKGTVYFSDKNTGIIDYAICGKMHITKECLDYVAIDAEKQSIEMKSVCDSERPYENNCKTFHMVIYNFKGPRPTVRI